MDDVRRRVHHELVVHQACAPNFLALEFIRKIAKVEISYAQSMMGSLPFALPLLLALPLLAYWLVPAAAETKRYCFHVGGERNKGNKTWPPAKFS